MFVPEQATYQFSESVHEVPGISRLVEQLMDGRLNVFICF